MAESVETRISTFENNSKKKTVNRNFQPTQPTTNQCHLLVKKRRRVILPIQPLTLFGMAGSLTNIQLIWSNGSTRELENSREQSIAAFPSF